ncbi:hypothetical protein [Bacillus thuringiensis]|uniref:hypothetical protein n=1 Tax=Bacillus thuringiensis TaxID=1428 RepID=UPI002AB38B05|nr:hypothetical protein [Bacillus thuringiensis]MDY8162288.1 hypothetical protein [Bacillus thuringiensis]
MFEWLNSLKDYMGTFSTSYPALAAATLTGSVTFIAGMLSQVLSHYFTKKREREKSLKEAITHLYSPLSIEIYQYLLLRGELLDPLSLEPSEKSKMEKTLQDSWDKITEILTNDTQFITIELSHNFKQTQRYFNNDIIFFQNFFKEFIKISKKIGFKAKIKNYTFEELLYLLNFYQLVSHRYGERTGLYTFQVMDAHEFHSISFKKVFKQLDKEKFKKYDLNRNSFDNKFETLVLNNISNYDKENWEKYIQKDFPRRKAYHNTKRL